MLRNFVAMAAVFALGVLAEIAFIIGVLSRFDGTWEPNGLLGAIFVLPLFGVVLAPVLALQLLAWRLSANRSAALLVGLLCCAVGTALAQGDRTSALALLAPVPLSIGCVAMRYRPVAFEARKVLVAASLVAGIALVVALVPQP